MISYQFNSFYKMIQLNKKKSLKLLSSSLSTLSSSTTTSSYQFIDCGDGQRLERFGEKLIIRPCTVSTWKKKEELQSLWNSYDSIYKHNQLGGNINGKWVHKLTKEDEKNEEEIREDEIESNSIDDEEYKENEKEEWKVTFEEINKTFILNYFNRGQVGIFPEQLTNWIWLSNKMKKLLEDKKKNEKLKIEDNNNNNKIKILNLFGYTGASSIACYIHPNIEVTHIDASKKSNLMVKKNFNINNINNNYNIKIYLDDCITFIKKEIKRNKKYNGIILDPPSYGKYKNKTWKLSKDFNILLKLLPELLEIDNNNIKKNSFILVTCHDDKINHYDLKKMLQISLPSTLSTSITSGEMVLKSTCGGNSLPLGVYSRWEY